MAKIEKEDLGYLSFDYQIRLMLQLLTDEKFADSIIDILEPNFFHDEFLKIIAVTIKEAKEKDGIVPNLESIRIRLLTGIKDDTQRKFLLTLLEKVKNADTNDTFKTQEIAMQFCKQQALKKSIMEIQKIIDKGDEDNYNQCEVILRKALEHGNFKEDGIDVLDNIESVLADDYRNPIRTGIKDLDEIMNGGLSKGELAIILAAFGVGKTTMITKIGNTAMLDGKNVVQIFFEDMPKIIQRKHLSCWSKIPLNDLGLHKEQLKEMTDKMLAECKGKLVLKKFSSGGTTMPMIKQYLRKLIAKGFRPDIVLLDYIDCVVPSKTYSDVNIGEGSVMREFEAMLSELEIAGWTAIQGGRGAIGADVVEANQMAGSIKKGMIGHFIVSVGKTLDQKVAGTATMAILKSRFGADGVIYPDIVFDNSTIQIEMSVNKKGPRTQVEHIKEVASDKQQHINEVMDNAKNRKKLLDSNAENKEKSEITIKTEN